MIRTLRGHFYDITPHLTRNRLRVAWLPRRRTLSNVNTTQKEVNKRIIARGIHCNRRPSGIVGIAAHLISNWFVGLFTFSETIHPWSTQPHLPARQRGTHEPADLQHL